MKGGSKGGREQLRDFGSQNEKYGSIVGPSGAFAPQLVSNRRRGKRVRVLRSRSQQTDGVASPLVIVVSELKTPLSLISLQALSTQWDG